MNKKNVENGTLLGQGVSKRTWKKYLTQVKKQR